MSKERLQKILAQAGVASRRGAEQLIAQGRVSVDGQVVTEPGTQADPRAQVIAVDGKRLAAKERLEYWMLNKPTGVVSTASDPQGRPTVVDLLPPDAKGRLYPVGRLDQDSEGLVLLTNHGELAQRLMHPKYQIAKRYLVWVQGRPSARTLEALRQGVELDGDTSAPAQGGPEDRRQQKLQAQLYAHRRQETRDQTHVPRGGAPGAAPQAGGPGAPEAGLLAARASQTPGTRRN